MTRTGDDDPIAAISDKLEEMGLTVSFVGDIISGFIKDGYTPMVW